MATNFYKEVEGIYRLRVPFENIYTSVFLITENEKNILVDCATTPDDVDLHIVPALKALGLETSDISAIVITHKHGDHAGGLERILELEPRIEVVREARAVTECISTCALNGHTLDCIGILDCRTCTLISGDAIQGAGVDKYRCSLKDKNAYLETIECIRRDIDNGKIENILFSHAYEPWDSDRAIGALTSLSCLKDAVSYFLF